MLGEIETIYDDNVVDEKNEFELLSIHDTELLEETAEKVIRKIIEDFPEELPEVVIFPDSSARPLMYLFDEAFSKVAESRGIEKPKYAFFQSASNEDENIRSIRREHYSRDPETYKRNVENINDLSNLLEEKFNRNVNYYSGVEAKTLSIYIDKKEALKESYPKLLGILKNRMKKILNSTKNNRVIGIDEQANGDATTLSEINNIYKELVGKNMNVYALTSADLLNPDVFSGKRMGYGFNPRKNLSDDPFFHYRRPDQHGLRSTYGVNRVPLTESQYVKTDNEANKYDMTKLRKDMRRIGVRVAGRL